MPNGRTLSPALNAYGEVIGLRSDEDHTESGTGDETLRPTWDRLVNPQVGDPPRFSEGESEPFPDSYPGDGERPDLWDELDLDRRIRTR